MRNGFTTLVREPVSSDAPLDRIPGLRDLQREAANLLAAIGAAAEAGDENETMRLALDLAQNRVRRMVVVEVSAEAEAPAPGDTKAAA